MSSSSTSSSHAATARALEATAAAAQEALRGRGGEPGPSSSSSSVALLQPSFAWVHYLGERSSQQWQHLVQLSRTREGRRLLATIALGGGICVLGTWALVRASRASEEDEEDHQHHQGWLSSVLGYFTMQGKQSESQAESSHGEGIVVEFNKYEKTLKEELVYPHQIKENFDSIGGLQEEVKRIKELVVLPLKKAHLYRRSRLATGPSGLLLYGPPGTGKTLLAKALAKQCGAAFLNVSPSALLSKWVGESEKLTTAVFSLARKLSPTVIFIDEIDGLLSSRNTGQENSVHSKVKTLFMSCWDGLATQHAEYVDVGTNGTGKGTVELRNWVFVIGATNRPWALDEAILRRLPHQLKVDVPNFEARKHIIRILLKEEDCFDSSGLDLDTLARMTNNYTGSDLKEVCRLAVLQVIKDADADEQRLIDAEENRASEEWRQREDIRDRYKNKIPSQTADEKSNLQAKDVTAELIEEISSRRQRPPSWLTVNQEQFRERREEDIADRKYLALENTSVPLRKLQMNDFIEALRSVKPSGASAYEYLEETQSAMGSSTPTFTPAGAAYGEGIRGNSKRLLGALQGQQQPE
eukprot:gb/GECG01015049.1/.p1 GENE.gb/GECG01015049.1/~~gb/GECG01015049.1/.p1  ORF type:complete len:583 (+),score=102.87 gb/GECG01015049.1/:1-1749(+)